MMCVDFESLRQLKSVRQGKTHIARYPYMCALNKNTETESGKVVALGEGEERGRDGEKVRTFSRIRSDGLMWSVATVVDRT